MFLRLQIVKNTYNFGGGAEDHNVFTSKIYKLCFIKRKIECVSYLVAGSGEVESVLEFIKYIKRYKELDKIEEIEFKYKHAYTREDGSICSNELESSRRIKTLNRSFKELRDFEMHGSFEELDFDSFDEEELYKRVLKLPKKGSINISFKV